MDNPIAVDLHGFGLPAQSLHLGGAFHFEQYRNGKLIDEWDSKNVVTNAGINHALNVVFAGATPVSPWYVSIFVNAYTPIITDTSANFVADAGEATDKYSESARPAFVEAASTAKSITNAANKAQFTCSTAATINGAALYSSAIKGSTSDILMAASRFATGKPMEVGDLLLVTYTINGASA